MLVVDPLRGQNFRTPHPHVDSIRAVRDAAPQVPLQNAALSNAALQEWHDLKFYPSRLPLQIASLIHRAFALGAKLCNLSFFYKPESESMRHALLTRSIVCGEGTVTASGLSGWTVSQQIALNTAKTAATPKEVVQP